MQDRLVDRRKTLSKPASQNKAKGRPSITIHPTSIRPAQTIRPCSEGVFRSCSRSSLLSLPPSCLLTTPVGFFAASAPACGIARLPLPTSLLLQKQTEKQSSVTDLDVFPSSRHPCQLTPVDSTQLHIMTSHGIVIQEPPSGSSPNLTRNSHEEDEALTTERTSKSNQKLALMSVRSRNAVSRRDDETDEWGVNDLNAKLEWKLMISDPELKSTVLTRLNTLRQNRELCDVAIFVREREIVAHKVVLASLSPVLLDKFLNDATKEPVVTTPTAIEPTTTSGTPAPKTTTAGLPFYELNYVDYESFVALVNYAYTGKLFISNRKVADLYKTTYELEIYPVANACARYLAEHLSVQSCIGIRRHANFNKDAFLVEKVDKFIAENIDAVITDSTEFSALPCIKTRVILPTGDLQKPDIGEEVCERVLEYFSNLTWTADRNDLQIESMAEKKHLLYIDASTGSLQDCVRLDAASQVGACEMVRDYVRNDGTKKCGHNKQPLGAEKIEHHINGAIRLNAVAKNDGKYASNESLESVETGPSDTQDEIETKLIVASETSKYFWVSIVVLFRRLVTISLQLTEDDEIIRDQVRAASEANGASAVSERNTTSKSIESPSPAASTASSDGTDIKQVADIAVQPASLLARLMSTTRANRVPLPPMGIARCSIGAVFLEGKIIICGGYDRGECLKSVEQYDVSKGNWSPLPDMFTERGRFDASVANGKVFAVAGSSGNRDLNTAESYDPKERKWAKIGNLHISRSQNVPMFIR
uniref:BTB domain-containing protein n=1 Tax=Panagrellus redivivus TaxID=6233 RepID=A0A7E4W4A8_PANRE